MAMAAFFLIALGAGGLIGPLLAASWDDSLRFMPGWFIAPAAIFGLGLIAAVL